MIASSPKYTAPDPATAEAIAAADMTCLLHLGRNRGEEQPQPERVRETRQEKEARRTERERQARLKERERSMQEEGVDGGYLVTLGTYIGPEDYSKPVVRQLQVRGNRLHGA
jgi:L-2-hydroxyglutarate oxidase LhgO